MGFSLSVTCKGSCMLVSVCQTWSETLSWQNGLCTKYRAQRGRNNLETGVLIWESVVLNSVFCFRDSHLGCLREKKKKKKQLQALLEGPFSSWSVTTAAFSCRSACSQSQSQCPELILFSAKPSVLAFRLFCTHCSSIISSIWNKKMEIAGAV